MTSPINYVIDDKDLDDAALWEVIDSAAASLSSVTSKSRKPLFATKHTNQHHHQSPNLKLIVSNPSPPIKLPKNPRNHHSTDGEVLQDRWTRHRPLKMARSSCAADISETVSPPLAMVKHLQRTPTTPKYSSPDTRRFEVNEYSPIGSDCSPMSYGQYEEKETPRHSLAGRFPSVSLFKEYQNAAMAILEKSDYTMISGKPFIKKSGWRKISFYFNLSYEIKDKTIEFDENRNVQRAEFVVRAHMQGGRFSDGWGSCERREKRFLHPNHDIPSTAETRAKNKACQAKLCGIQHHKFTPLNHYSLHSKKRAYFRILKDLLGIGEYQPGASDAQR